jgi:hypothetical protein
LSQEVSTTIPSTFPAPTIAWVNPAAITHGTALGGTQLNATANVAGTFVYTPASGTMLNAGAGQTLSVTFTPTDTANYATATKTVTITVTNTAPSVTLAPATLRFVGTNTNGTSSSLTGAQSVTVTFSAPTSSTWTATANQPWVQMTNGTGTGSGTFTVGIINPGNVLAGVTQAAATITVTASGASNSPQSVVVDLTLRQAAANAAPFGLVDTPLQNATGIVGAIGVTGWVVDDVGVAGVKVYRNCLSFEPPTNCVRVGGASVVFVGDATLVTGARPDVEALYSTYPQANRAAWGYLLLTNLLPHVPNAQMFGGQGPLTLYALATDVEGKQTWLGRTQGDTTPTAITLANDTIAKPFGAIDTPGQGETVSGIVLNFGWALTPDSHMTPGAGDALASTTESPLQVYVDGAPIGAVVYNQCRGTVGSPVPAGVYCDDDVSSIFGNPVPLATFTPRTTNLTKHRNLDAGRGAIGTYLLDTTTLANGVHTIMWGATDSAGRSEGFGNRYFTVLNAGPSFDSRSDTPALAQDRDAGAVQGFGPAEDQLVAGGVQDVSAAVTARTGFDLAAPWVNVTADDAGVRYVQLSELGRLELRLGSVDAGYLAANGELHDLPPGSHLEAATGYFTWAPGVGYYGTYRLTFVRAGEPIAVDVTIRPAAAAAPGEAEIRMYVDTPIDREVVSGPLTVAGWALDPQATVGSGIDAVHVWTVRADVAGSEPVFLGAAALGGTRPDVGTAFGPSFGTAGFSLTSDGLAPGRYEMTVYVWNRRTARWEDARTMRITVR